jgi:hypothetical protein
MESCEIIFAKKDGGISCFSAMRLVAALSVGFSADKYRIALIA